LDLTFFGLTQFNAAEFRLNLFSQIHQIVFHGNGGYDWHTIYNMPVWLRLFTFNQIKEHYDKEREEYDKSINNSENVAIGTDGLVKNRSLFQNQPSPLPSKPGVLPKKPAKYK
jgi:hypothetical protein